MTDLEASDGNHKPDTATRMPSPHYPRMERALLMSCAALLAAVLSTWVWFTVLELTDHTVNWWVAVAPACTMLGMAFCLDVFSTARFGTHLILKWETSPLMRWTTRRGGLRWGIAVQATTLACAVAALPLLPLGQPPHHVLLSLTTALSVCHCVAWWRNNRYWEVAS